MTRQLKIKVCGMKFTENRQEVEKLGIDMLGFIFYPLSKRFVGEIDETDLFNTSILKVGVFVNQNGFEILAKVKKLELDYVQLHGNENPQTCQLLKNQGLKIIKAFGIDDTFNFETTEPFQGKVSFFLFDTKTSQYGGSGQKFDWQILEKYKGHTPFFISGGIGPDDAESILKINHPKLTGVDINSGFEDEPGIKNIEKLKDFIDNIQTLRNSE